VEWQMLSSMVDSDRRALLARCRRCRFPKGGYICHEGEIGDTVHLIAMGTVSVQVTSPHGDVVTLDVLQPGDSFGEQALIGQGSVRSATILAIEKTETMRFSRVEFDSLWKAAPEAATAMARILDARLRATSQALLEALYLPADVRVLRRLDYLAGIYSHHSAQAIPLTQDDLASMAGTTRQTVNRVLGRAQDDGLLSLSRGRIVVSDPIELARRARRDH
jgi:CRP/FNR family transcriptional regulator, cyclic AMP receptor protein